MRPEVRSLTSPTMLARADASCSPTALSDVRAVVQDELQGRPDALKEEADAWPI